MMTSSIRIERLHRLGLLILFGVAMMVGVSGSHLAHAAPLSPDAENACTAALSQGAEVPSGSDLAFIQSLLDCAAPGSVITFEHGGVFGGGLVINTPGITLDLNGGTFGHGSPFVIINAPNVTLIGPAILDGAGDPSPAVLVTGGGDNFTLDGVEIRNWLDGVQIDSSVTSFKLVNNWIHNNADAGLQVDAGVTLGGVVTIEGNLFKGNGGNGVQNNSGVALDALDATYNSWGADGGPGAVNGDGVSANVLFDPWTFAEVYVDVNSSLAGDQVQRDEFKNNSFNVDLRVDGENLYGVSFKINYDPGQLTLNSVTFDPVWDGSCLLVGAPTPGVIQYHCSLISGPAWDGGSIATINFSADGVNLIDPGPWVALLDIASAEADTSAAATGGVKVFVNNAGFGPASAPNRGISDANDGQINIGALAIDKTMIVPNNRTVVYVGEEVTFRVTITNTTPFNIAVLPLNDFFPNTCLEYESKTATPQESTFDNGIALIQWTDLTLRPEGDLLPGETIEVTVPFNVIAAAGVVTNTAEINGALTTGATAVPVYSDDFSFTCGGADFGDAPDPTYPTLQGSNGARHIITPDLYLGASVDSEADGQPNANATGDDLAGIDDEDGVQIDPLLPGATIEVTINAHINNTTGLLDAWIDFGDDGSWAQPGDQIFASLPLVDGINVLNFIVPNTATITPQTFARFRVSSAGGLSPTGVALDGEVEDYAVEIFPRSTISGFIWLDIGADGIITPPIEPTLGINNVPVDLTWAGPDGILGNGDDQTFSTLTVFGAFSFNNLLPGNFRMDVIESSLPLMGKVRVSGDNPMFISLLPGQSMTSANVGYLFGTSTQLSTVEVTASQEAVTLRWQGWLDDGQPSSFEVLRSTTEAGDGLMTLAQVDASASDGQWAQYEYSDDSVQAGASYYYWLRGEDDVRYGPWFMRAPNGWYYWPMIRR